MRRKLAVPCSTQMASTRRKGKKRNRLRHISSHKSIYADFCAETNKFWGEREKFWWWWKPYFLNLCIERKYSWHRDIHVVPHVYKLQEAAEQGSLQRNPSHKLPSEFEVLSHWQLHGAAPTSSWPTGWHWKIIVPLDISFLYIFMDSGLFCPIKIVCTNQQDDIWLLSNIFEVILARQFH